MTCFSARLKDEFVAPVVGLKVPSGSHGSHKHNLMRCQEDCWLHCWLLADGLAISRKCGFRIGIKIGGGGSERKTCPSNVLLMNFF